ncbi:hypothetical protein CRG98_004481 [Punica granatum]|uniref:Uncharacterized protein n=1 Tax=Punica granatum TaxID=22663 RepID=A0A2I0L4T0_PUNGR|nr:hypothetical protein CRG98_004481 [Punica granatum]
MASTWRHGSDQRGRRRDHWRRAEDHHHGRAPTTTTETPSNTVSASNMRMEMSETAGDSYL